MEERALRKEIVWKNKIAYVAPLVATAIGAIGSISFLEHQYDEFKQNVQASFLSISSVVAVGTTYSMPKSVGVNSYNNNNLYGLRKKSKHLDDNIHQSASLGLIRGVCLPGTVLVCLLAPLLGKYLAMEK